MKTDRMGGCTIEEGKLEILSILFPIRELCYAGMCFLVDTSMSAERFEEKDFGCKSVSVHRPQQLTFYIGQSQTISY